MYRWKKLQTIGKYIPLKQNEIFKKFIYLHVHVSCKLIKTLPTVIVFPPFRDLSSGDHIAAEVKIDGNTYFKHGIFIGHIDGIIDLVKMKNVDISNFNETFKLLKITYPTSKSLPSQTVVENAKKMMNSCEVRSHDPRCQDSEKYASTCKTGMKEATVDINQKLNAFVSIVNVPTAPSANLSLGSLFGSI